MRLLKMDIYNRPNDDLESRKRYKNIHKEIIIIYVFINIYIH